MGILDWLRGKRQRQEHSSGRNLPSGGGNVVIRLNDDHTHAANQDIITGLEFHATLQIRTPLSVLEHHGEVFKGPPSEAPRYGSMADGIWPYKLKSYEDILSNEGPTEIRRGFGEPEYEHSYDVASDVGPVKPLEYLLFLKDFRRIVEQPTTVADRLNKLNSLACINAVYQRFWQKLCDNYQDFPESFFIWS